MALTAYSYYRLVISKAANGGNGYVTVNEFGLYTDKDHSGTNLAIGATATAISQYDANTGAAKAIDGNASTFWESNSASGDKWLQVQLGSAAVVRSVYISSTTYPGEVPRDFQLQASNDGSTWVAIFSWVDWVTADGAKSSYEKINLKVGGESKLDSGVRSSKVLLYNWASGALIASIIPNTDGSWEYRPANTNDLLVTHIGPSGYRPVSDGPITPYSG